MSWKEGDVAYLKVVLQHDPEQWEAGDVVLVLFENSGGCSVFTKDLLTAEQVAEG